MAEMALALAVSAASRSSTSAALTRLT